MSLSTGQREKVLRMIDEFEKNEVGELKGGGLRGGARANPSTRTADMKIAEFIADTLSGVLTTQQMKGMVQVGDPKFLNPPMTDTQRTVVTERVMRSVLSADQIRQFATNGAVAMDTLTPVQKSIIADLAAGYAAGNVLNLNQFRTFASGTTPTIMSAEQALRLRPFTRVDGDPSPPVYNSMRTPASPHYMQLGRLMDRPATDMVSTGRGLSGGANSTLAILKNQISQVVGL